MHPWKDELRWYRKWINDIEEGDWQRANGHVYIVASEWKGITSHVSKEMAQCLWHGCHRRAAKLKEHVLDVITRYDETEWNGYPLSKYVCKEFAAYNSPAIMDWLLDHKIGTVLDKFIRFDHMEKKQFGTVANFLSGVGTMVNWEPYLQTLLHRGFLVTNKVSKHGPLHLLDHIQWHWVRPGFATALSAAGATFGKWESRLLSKSTDPTVRQELTQIEEGSKTYPSTGYGQTGFMWISGPRWKARRAIILMSVQRNCIGIHEGCAARPRALRPPPPLPIN